MFHTELIEIREPTTLERSKDSLGYGTDKVFVRWDNQGNEYKVFVVCTAHSFRQWGSDSRVLKDNMDSVRHWYNEMMNNG